MEGEETENLLDKNIKLIPPQRPHRRPDPTKQMRLDGDVTQKLESRVNYAYLWIMAAKEDNGGHTFTCGMMVMISKSFAD